MIQVKYFNELMRFDTFIYDDDDPITNRRLIVLEKDRARNIIALEDMYYHDESFYQLRRYWPLNIPIRDGIKNASKLVRLVTNGKKVEEVEIEILE